MAQKPVPPSFVVKALERIQALEPDAVDQRLAKDVASEVYALKVQGCSYEEISNRTGIPVGDIERCIDERVEVSRARRLKELEVTSILELDRLDQMLHAIWPKVEEGDLGAQKIALMISAERRKLLGLDAPEVRAAINLAADAGTDLKKLSTAELKQLADLTAKSQTQR